VIDPIQIQNRPENACCSLQARSKPFYLSLGVRPSSSVRPKHIEKSKQLGKGCTVQFREFFRRQEVEVVIEVIEIIRYGNLNFEAREGVAR
jgi:hypothetical protein